MNNKISELIGLPQTYTPPTTRAAQAYSQLCLRQIANPEARHQLRQQNQLAMERHIARITRLQTLIEIEEKKLKECLQQERELRQYRPQPSLEGESL